MGQRPTHGGSTEHETESRSRRRILQAGAAALGTWGLTSVVSADGRERECEQLMPDLAVVNLTDSPTTASVGLSSPEESGVRTQQQPELGPGETRTIDSLGDAIGPASVQVSADGASAAISNLSEIENERFRKGYEVLLTDDGPKVERQHLDLHPEKYREMLRGCA